MTTVAGARSELVTALAAVRATTVVTADAPYALVLRDGVAPARVATGQMDASFTVRLVAGTWDSAAAADQLDADLQTVLQVLRGLDGWILGDVGPDAGRDYQGSTYLTCDVACSRRVDI